jgi:hypothetical protein
MDRMSQGARAPETSIASATEEQPVGDVPVGDELVER